MSATQHAIEPIREVEIFKCLADMNRLRILNLLDEMPLCVCHIEQILGIGNVRTSQNLSYLKRHGLVQVEIRGTWRVYSLCLDAGSEFEVILNSLRDSTFHSPMFSADRETLKSQSSCR